MESKKLYTRSKKRKRCFDYPFLHLVNFNHSTTPIYYYYVISYLLNHVILLFFTPSQKIVNIKVIPPNRIDLRISTTSA